MPFVIVGCGKCLGDAVGYGYMSVVVVVVVVVLEVELLSIRDYISNPEIFYFPKSLHDVFSRKHFIFASSQVPLR